MDCKHTMCLLLDRVRLSRDYSQLMMMDTPDFEISEIGITTLWLRLVDVRTVYNCITASFSRNTTRRE